MTTLDEKLKKYFDDTFSCPDSDIYHYTKQGIGNEIVKSGFFRLKSHHDLNKQDNGELIVGSELAKKYLKKTDLASFESTFDKFLERGITIHVGSFCEERNNTHAIKKYGLDCLEFKAEYLKTLPQECNALIGSVKYDSNKQNEIISTMFGLYEESTDENPIQKRCTLLQWLFIASPLLKHRKHRPDIECRIVTVYGREKNNPANIIGKVKDQITFGSKDVILLR